MDGRIDLNNLLVSAPRIYEVSEKIVNINGVIFTPGVVKSMIIENYGGLKRVRLVGDASLIAIYPMHEKIECTVEQTIEDETEGIIVKNIR